MTDKEVYKELSYTRKNVYERIADTEKDKIFAFCDGYRDFLDKGKTERECVKEAVKLLESAGFRNLNEYEVLKAGDKVYTLNRGKNVFAAVIGTDGITDGINLVGAHIDSPRLDLKHKM